MLREGMPGRLGRDSDVAKPLRRRHLRLQDERAVFSGNPGKDRVLDAQAARLAGGLLESTGLGNDFVGVALQGNPVASLAS
jgi:hypothetical protein